jgi:predicted phage-related endonuclease
LESIKTRYYITPSSLASYFGCGFNSPEEQFKIDSGEIAADFDDDSKLRMELGNHLEDAVIEYFQNIIFKNPITDRNTETKWGYDGKIRYKLDGKTILKDEVVIFENKISNSQSYKFTENKGYHIQVQAYMLCENLNKTILAGLYQGKPIYKIVERDEDLVDDIKTMTDFVVSALNGLVDFYNDYPVDLLEKYSNSKLYEPITDLSDSTIEYLHQLADLNEKKSEIEKEIKDLKNKHENDFEITSGTYEDDYIKVSVSRWTQSGGFDLDEFTLRNPDVDIKPYMKEPSERSKVTIKKKK